MWRWKAGSHPCVPGPGVWPGFSSHVEQSRGAACGRRQPGGRPRKFPAYPVLPEQPDRQSASSTGCGGRLEVLSRHSGPVFEIISRLLRSTNSYFGIEVFWHISVNQEWQFSVPITNVIYSIIIIKLDCIVPAQYRALFLSLYLQSRS